MSLSPECVGFLCDDASPPAVTHLRHHSLPLSSVYSSDVIPRRASPLGGLEGGGRVQGNHWLAAEERQDGRPTRAEDYGKALPTYSLPMVRSGNMLQLGNRTYLIETHGTSFFLLLIHPDTKRTWSDVTTCLTSDVFTLLNLIKHFIFQTFYFIFLIST